MSVEPAKARRRNARAASHRSNPVQPWLAVGMIVSAATAVAVLLIATQFRLIADDYAHVAGVLTRGIVGNTTYWFGIELAGIPGLVILGGFSWLVGHMSWVVGQVPYTVFLLATVWLFGAVAAAFMGARTNRRVVGIGLLAIPMWVLSIGNVLGDYDVQSLMGMLNWISAGYRTTLPFWFATLFLALATSASWRSTTRLVVGAAGGLFVTLSSLNLLPDLAAYLAITLVAAAFLTSTRAKQFVSDPPAPRQGFMAAAVGIAVGILVLWLAPATALRRERHPLLLSWQDSPAAFIGQLANFTREWMNVSNLLVAVVAAGVTLLLLIGAETRLGEPERRQASARVRQRAAAFAVTAWLLVFMLVVTGAFGDVLTYGGVFHRWSVQQAAFIGFVALGVFMGATIGTRGATNGDRSTRRTAMIGVATVFCLLVTMVPLARMATMAIERRQLWETGQPAPLGFMADRDARDWLAAWQQIEGIRDGANPAPPEVGQ